MHGMADHLLCAGQLFLTDGTNAMMGCVNTTGTAGAFVGCLDADIQQANFTFAPGELVTAMNAWPGTYDGPSKSDAEGRIRAGALSFTTSLVRLPWNMPALHCAAFMFLVHATRGCLMQMHIHALH